MHSLVHANVQQVDLRHDWVDIKDLHVKDHLRTAPQSVNKDPSLLINPDSSPFCLTIKLRELLQV